VDETIGGMNVVDNSAQFCLIEWKWTTCEPCRELILIKYIHVAPQR
jgi:hypothetical protein